MTETLNQLYDDLVKQLYIPTIFYFPRKIWSLVDKEKWDDTMYDDIFDKVFLIKPDGSDGFVNNELTAFHFLIKHERLDKNTFKLLDIEKNIDQKQFKFLLNKYCHQLHFCRKISNWILVNSQKDIKDLSKDSLMSYELQKNSFNNHWKTIEESFVNSPKIEDIKTNVTLSKKDYESIQNLIKPTAVFPKLIDTKVGQEGSDALIKQKKEKKILITEEEATDILLRKVFKINNLPV